MRKFAKHLMVCQAVRGKSSGTNTPEAFRALEQLRPQLTALMGDGGFRALLARVLALARAEVPWLRGLQVSPAGDLVGLEELRARLLDRAELFEGGVVLLARLLGLLVTFIGENLTVRLVREVWPEISPGKLDLGNGGKKNEKTK